ncbi:Imm47 family immunity protein [Paenibacillus sp. y28]|uniref:Imm47 family immunity protein n=1 Tax=Paenibacillus sp. y28 TaxID=3129110 RepID=UPI00301B3093
MNVNQERLTFVSVLFERPVSDLSPVQLWQRLDSAVSGEDRLLAAVDLVKRGEFEARQELAQLMLHSPVQALRELGCLIFCCAARHEDIPLWGQYVTRLIEAGNQEELKRALSCASYTLSPQVVPYLLAVLESWEDEELEERVRVVLDLLFPYRSFLAEETTVEDILSAFEAEFDVLESPLYFYEGEPVFPGVWTKELLARAMQARYDKEPLYMTYVPTLLSLWTGTDCPAYDSDPIDDATIERLYEYVKQMTGQRWERGTKYFFGRPV